MTATIFSFQSFKLYETRQFFDTKKIIFLRVFNKIKEINEWRFLLLIFSYIFLNENLCLKQTCENSSEREKKALLG